MHRLLEEVTDMKQLYRYISIKGSKTGFNVRHDVMDVKTGLYLHPYLTNNISVYSDVGWEVLAEIIVQK
jgi:hypothetical protein